MTIVPRQKPDTRRDSSYPSHHPSHPSHPPLHPPPPVHPRIHLVGHKNASGSGPASGFAPAPAPPINDPDVSLLRRTSTMYPDMLSLSLADLLESDPRPTFVVASELPNHSTRTSSTSSTSSLSSAATLVPATATATPSTATPSTSTSTPPSLSPNVPSIAYCNPALAKSPDLFNDLLSLPSDAKSKFWQWAVSPLSPPLSHHKSGRLSQYQAFGILWTRTLMDKKWIVIGANEQVPSAEPPRKIRIDSQILPNGATRPSRLTMRQPVESPTSLSMPETPTVAIQSPRWVLPEFMPDQEPFLDVIQGVHWESTPVGAMDTWHPRLQQTFKQIMVDSRPIAIFWGPKHTVVYNEAYSKFVGSKHPSLLGKTVDEAWPEAAPRLKETMQTASSKRRATLEDESRYFIPRSDGTFEEIYLKWSIIPITESEEYLGFIHPVLETTSMRLWERRMKMLIDLGEVLASSRDVKAYWSKTMEELDSVNPCYDIPLAILYSVEEDDDTTMSDSQSGFSCDKTLNFEGSLGVPEGHPIIPTKLPLRMSEIGLSACFRDALRSRHPILAEVKNGSLPESLLEGLHWRGFGDPCRAAVICPIRPTKEESVMGLLFLGLNPRRPYDNDYRQYISLLNQKLTTSLASTVLLEEETRRRRNVAEQAAYDQAVLKKELAFKQQEATESMQRFRAVAEFIPIGMCFGDLEGNINYANDAWYRITGHPRSLVEGGGFLPCVLEEDQANVARAYVELKDHDTADFVFRVRQRDSNPCSPLLGSKSPAFEASGFDYYGLNKEPQQRFVSAAAKAERSPDGSIANILTCLTDVTIHKKTADEAIRRAQQAENLKRMAELSTVGMYDMDLHGKLIGANNVFYEMCGIDPVDMEAGSVKVWEVAIDEEDLHLIQDCLKEMLANGTTQNTEVRLRTLWVVEDNAGKMAAPRWVNATLMPIKNKTGTIESFTGCFSDVSLQKWQLQRERARKEEAIESKRLQDSFIDMTSHEMRNPLSAMIHCADAVISSLSRIQNMWRNHPDVAVACTDWLKSHSQISGDSDSLTLIANSIDNGETIISCAQHQKRIVDDILTMSKLDSKLLAVTPITVDPIQIVQEALKMFSVEARRVDIDLSMIVDRSYHDIKQKFLALDPSRMKQVLINLLTNALKFTKAESTRNVSVTIRAFKRRPTTDLTGIDFIPRAVPLGEEEFPQPALENRGPPIYLMFEVEDTGQGLTDEEKSNLFKRFGQASVKTHVKYGGSGLGLFISRSLAELQRGAIGVSSRPGFGSTFAFFIETYEPTKEELEEALSVQTAYSTSFSTPSRQHYHAKTQSQAAAIHIAPTMLEPVALEIDGILVVEDNLVNQSITKRGLVDAGFLVNVANHGQEALDKLERTKWFRSLNLPPPATTNGAAKKDTSLLPLSVVLMDMEMPIMDGLTCTRRIREMEAQAKVRGRLPIIAVSANARTEQILEAKMAGCDDVLVKPYRMPELIEKMKIVIRRMGELEKTPRVTGEATPDASCGEDEDYLMETESDEEPE